MDETCADCGTPIKPEGAGKQKEIEFSLHRQDDPHCTCPDCLEFHYGDDRENTPDNR